MLMLSAKSVLRAEMILESYDEVYILINSRPEIAHVANNKNM